MMNQLQKLMAERAKIQAALADKKSFLEAAEADLVTARERHGAASASEALGEPVDTKATHKALEKAQGAVQIAASTVEGLSARLAQAERDFLNAADLFEAEQSTADGQFFEGIAAEWQQFVRGPVLAKALELLAKIDGHGAEDARGLKLIITSAEIPSPENIDLNLLSFEEARWDNALGHHVYRPAWVNHPSLEKLVKGSEDARAFRAGVKREAQSIRKKSSTEAA